MNSDEDWIRWGRQDPYYAVITQPRFRAAALTDEARQEFFDSGRWHAEHVLGVCRRLAGDAWAPRRVLDFGCGVGRVALALAAHAESVVGLDVSPEMLAEAQRNALARGVVNAQWRLSDDELSAAEGLFDLVHSSITFQHIDIPRGRTLFRHLLQRLAPGGAAALHITYAKAQHADTFGQPLAPPSPQAPLPGALARPPHPVLRAFRKDAPGVAASANLAVPAGDPGMQMNAYHLGEIAWLMQAAGVRRFETEFTDHGGEWGVFLYFTRG
jgi:SAM-dependent methyltransferase